MTSSRPISRGTKSTRSESSTLSGMAQNRVMARCDDALRTSTAAGNTLVSETILTPTSTPCFDCDQSSGNGRPIFPSFLSKGSRAARMMVAWRILSRHPVTALRGRGHAQQSEHHQTDPCELRATDRTIYISTDECSFNKFQKTGQGSKQAVRKPRCARSPSTSNIYQAGDRDPATTEHARSARSDRHQHTCQNENGS